MASASVKLELQLPLGANTGECRAPGSRELESGEPPTCMHAMNRSPRMGGWGMGGSVHSTMHKCTNAQESVAKVQCDNLLLHGQALAEALQLPGQVQVGGGTECSVFPISPIG